MPAPWEKYGGGEQQPAGPWAKYGSGAPAPAAPPPDEQPGFWRRFGETVVSPLTAFGSAISNIGNPGALPTAAASAGAEALTHGASPAQAVLASVPVIGQPAEDIRQGHYRSALGTAAGMAALGGAARALPTGEAPATTEMAPSTPPLMSRLGAAAKAGGPDILKGGAKVVAGNIIPGPIGRWGLEYPGVRQAGRGFGAAMEAFKKAGLPTADAELEGLAQEIAGKPLDKLTPGERQAAMDTASRIKNGLPQGEQGPPPDMRPHFGQHPPLSIMGEPSAGFRPLPGAEPAAPDLRNGLNFESVTAPRAVPETLLPRFGGQPVKMDMPVSEPRMITRMRAAQPLPTVTPQLPTRSAPVIPIRELPAESTQTTAETPTGVLPSPSRGKPLTPPLAKTPLQQAAEAFKPEPPAPTPIDAGSLNPARDAMRQQWARTMAKALTEHGITAADLEGADPTLLDPLAERLGLSPASKRSPETIAALHAMLKQAETPK